MPQRLTRKIPLAALVFAGAMTMAGCAGGPRPLSFEEKVWFDKATGLELVGHRFHDYAPLPYPPPLPPPAFEEPYASARMPAARQPSRLRSN